MIYCYQITKLFCFKYLITVTFPARAIVILVLLRTSKFQAFGEVSQNAGLRRDHFYPLVFCTFIPLFALLFCPSDCKS